MINNIICKKCGHFWIARTEYPKQCPRCKRYDWNKEKEVVEESDSNK